MIKKKNDHRTKNPDNIDNNIIKRVKELSPDWLSGKKLAQKEKDFYFGTKKFERNIELSFRKIRFLLIKIAVAFAVIDLAIFIVLFLKNSPN